MSDDSVIEVYDPGNDELIGSVASASREDVENALATASNSIDLANDVDYGLQAGVFTRDLATAHRVAWRALPTPSMTISGQRATSRR